MLKNTLSPASIVLVLICTWSSVDAENYPPRYSYYDDPAYYIMNAVEKIQNFNTNSPNVPPAVVRDFLENQIIPLFDFVTMARWIIGPYAQYMTTADQRKFYKDLKNTFLSSLGNHLGSFDSNNTRIRYYPARFKNNGEAIVSTQVIRTGQYPARLIFRMKHDGYTWKIIDVKANGTSAVLYYRNHFISRLRQY